MIWLPGLRQLPRHAAHEHDRALQLQDAALGGDAAEANSGDAANAKTIVATPLKRKRKRLRTCSYTDLQAGRRHARLLTPSRCCSSLNSNLSPSLNPTGSEKQTMLRILRTSMRTHSWNHWSSQRSRRRQGRAPRPVAWAHLWRPAPWQELALLPHPTQHLSWLSLLASQGLAPAIESSPLVARANHHGQILNQHDAAAY